MTKTELAWLAGWLEGEGSFGHASPNPRGLRISATSTDLDILQRVQALLGGHIYGPTDRSAGKPLYGWSLTRSRDAAYAMQKLLPLLGTRRAARIRELLDAWERNPARLPAAERTRCPAGHLYSGANLRLTPAGHRRCKQCERDRRDKARAERMFVARHQELTR